MRQYLAKACRLVLEAVHTLTKAVEEGVIPHPGRSTSVEDNIAWGNRWIAGVVASVLAGETITVGKIDVFMLVLFVASVVVARRSASHPVIVYSAT